MQGKGTKTKPCFCSAFAASSTATWVVHVYSFIWLHTLRTTPPTKQRRSCHPVFCSQPTKMPKQMPAIFCQAYAFFLPMWLNEGTLWVWHVPPRSTTWVMISRKIFGRCIQQGILHQFQTGILRHFNKKILESYEMNTLVKMFFLLLDVCHTLQQIKFWYILYIKEVPYLEIKHLWCMLPWCLWHLDPIYCPATVGTNPLLFGPDMFVFSRRPRPMKPDKTPRFRKKGCANCMAVVRLPALERLNSKSMIMKHFDWTWKMLYT